MIAEQIRGSLDVGPGTGMGLPTSPPSPPAVWGCPLNLPLHGMGMGDSLCMCFSLHLVSILLVGFFGTF